MPTGYTADVADGKVADFATFALRCARAFGATVMQRDDPMDDPPKHREVSDYYQRAVREAQAEAVRFSLMTEAEAEVAMEAERTEAEARNAEYRAEKDAKRARYEAMLREVEAWAPPTSDHVELKTFMAKQIRESIDFDCSDWEPAKTDVQPAGLWLAEKRVKAAQELQRRQTNLAEEVERCAKANAWIDALYDSLGVPA